MIQSWVTAKNPLGFIECAISGFHWLEVFSICLPEGRYHRAIDFTVEAFLTPVLSSIPRVATSVPLAARFFQRSLWGTGGHRLEQQMWGDFV